MACWPSPPKHFGALEGNQIVTLGTSRCKDIPLLMPNRAYVDLSGSIFIQSVGTFHCRSDFIMHALVENVMLL